MRTLDEFNDKYKGETCFIIGAGASIKYTNLEPLKDRLTIAVNSAYLAMETEFFISDDWSVTSWSYFCEDLVESKKTKALLYEDKLRSHACLFGDRAVLFRHRTGYNIEDHYDHNVRDYRICQARCSAGSAINIAHIMGCDKIVLLGVDCWRVDGFRYFWQYSNYENKPTRNDYKSLDIYRRCRVANKDTDTDLMNVLDYWKIAGEEMNKKCNVLNATPYSIIDVFPKVRLSSVL